MHSSNTLPNHSFHLSHNPNAMLRAGGGKYKDGGFCHLIWIAGHTLLPGEVLSVTLNELCDIADRGKTREELYPDQKPSTRSDFTINDEMAAEIRSRPRLHEAFIVQVGTSLGQQAQATSDDLNTGFTFG
jgi:hypothetical protein